MTYYGSLLCVPPLFDDIHTSFIFNAAMEFPAVAAACLLMRFFPRRQELSATLILSGLLFLVTIGVPGFISSII